MNYEEYLSSFDAEATKTEIVQWIRDWFSVNGPGCNAVIGISGGKDSSVVAALCVEALGASRVVGVLMPNGIQNDIDDAIALVEHLGIDFTQINIADAVDALKNSFVDLFVKIQSGCRVNIPMIKTNQAIVNLPPRIRMATLYMVAQSMNGRVANTCNLSEDWIGYSTRWGDSVGDFSPISKLTTDEVIAVGKTCGLPTELVEKVPAAGLYDGQTDEDELGFSYRDLNEYIKTGVCKNKEAKDKIDALHHKNRFKMQPIPYYDPDRYSF